MNYDLNEKEIQVLNGLLITAMDGPFSVENIKTNIQFECRNIMLDLKDKFSKKYIIVAPMDMYLSNYHASIKHYVWSSDKNKATVFTKKEAEELKAYVEQNDFIYKHVTITDIKE